MPLALGTALVMEIKVRSSGALYDPTPAPTVTEAAYPDGSLLSGLPLAMTKVRTGVYQATVFTTEQTATLIGTYTATANTSDAAVDAAYGNYDYAWKDVGLGDPATIADAVLDAVASDHNATGTIGALINLLSTIYSRITSIGSNVTYVSPVSPDGKTMHIVQNDDYLLANNRPLIFPLPIGFPLLTPGQAVTLAVAKFDKTTQLITGLALDDSTMRFEMPAATSKLMPRGKSDYSILELTSGVYRSTPYVGTAIVSRARTS